MVQQPNSPSRHQYWLGTGFAVVLGCFGVDSAIAQTVPPASVPSPSALPQETPLNRDPQPPSGQPLPEPAIPVLPPPEDLLPPSPETPQEPGPDVPETITVERFEVVGSTVFSPADFARVTQPFTNRPISLAELFQARSAVTQLYVDRGYITSGAFIPPQTLKGGVVTIQVVEGGLEDIKVRGLRRLNPNYVRSRLAIATQKPLNRARLLEALQLLQLNPLIQTISAELSAGTRPGESLLEVQVTETRSISTPLSLDNNRSPSVGSFRQQVQVIEGNLTGLGDRALVSYARTDGSRAFDASYSIPFNPRNGTVSLSVGTSNNDVIERPFNVLDIQSASRYYEVTVRQPIAESPSREIALGFTATHRQSEASLLDGEIPFPAVGADDEGRTRLTALRFFQEAIWRSSQEVTALRSQFSVGINALNATINDEAPDTRFFSWRGQAQWVRLLAPDTLLLLRGDVQLADRSLLPFEQFGLGGQETVRGYRQDALLTDNGLLLSAEVRIPILRLPESNGLLQLTPFIDFGTTWNSSDRPSPDPNTLVGAGLGLRFQLSDRITARLDWGIPLVTVSGEKRTWQEEGVYFSVVVTPF